MYEWIKVSEDLPVVGAHFTACSENVRVKLVDGSVCEGYFQTVTDEWYSAAGKKIPFEKVLAWQSI